MEKIYLDAVELKEREILRVITDGERKAVTAGTTISAMDVDFKKDYQHYAENEDLHFIFEDFLPKPKFYTVPHVDIIAVDSVGGFVGSLGQTFVIEADAPICYINKELESFIVAENGRDFVKNIASWKKRLKPYDKITFYRSKAEAEKELRFMDLPKGRIDEKNK